MRLFAARAAGLASTQSKLLGVSTPSVHGGPFGRALRENLALAEEAWGRGEQAAQMQRDFFEKPANQKL